MQPTCSNRGFLSCTLRPAWLGCVYEVDSEWTVRNANTVSYWYIPECPSDCAACSFLSSYSSVQPVLRHTMKELCRWNAVKQAFVEGLLATWIDETAADILYVEIRPSVGSTTLCNWWTGSVYLMTPSQSGICQTDRGHNSSLLWLCSFLSLNWVHVYWMSSNFFAVVLGHATLQWVLCISYLLLSFLVFLWRRQRLKSII